MNVYQYGYTYHPRIPNFEPYEDTAHLVAETLDEAAAKISHPFNWIKEVPSTEVQRLILADEPLDVLYHLRTLPLDQAEFLLDAYTYKVDGDNGYGSWPNVMADRKEWY